MNQDLKAQMISFLDNKFIVVVSGLVTLALNGKLHLGIDHASIVAGTAAVLAYVTGQSVVDKANSQKQA